MKLKKRFPLAVLSMTILILGGCSTLDTARIMDKNDAQVALTLNKNLSFNVIGVRAGKSINSCKKNDCIFDNNNVFAKKNFTITVVKGSCCAYISGGDETFEFCSPEYPIEFVKLVDGNKDICNGD